MQLINQLNSKLHEENSPLPLGLFRIFLGIILFIQTFSFIQSDFVLENLFNTEIQFKFSLFESLSVLPFPATKFLMLLMLASTVFIAIGRSFKIACGFYFLSFTYFWLLDKSYFNNHYYFISLLTFLLLFTNADAWGGSKSKKRETIPYWHPFILKAQIFLVFFIAGINKINPYWLLEHQPMKHILETKASVSSIPWVSSEFIIGFMSWGGMLFDLFIIPLIWYKKTRKYAFIVYVLFNLINFWLFHNIGEIGIFPFLLLACAILFIDVEFLKRKFKFLGKKKTQAKKNTSKDNKRILTLISIYFLIQLIIPFRHYLYTDYVDWTGEGQRFSWRMKIMYKASDIKFFLYDSTTQNKMEINYRSFLTAKQYTNLIYYPDFIPTLAKYIKNEGIKKGFTDTKVVADFNIGFMGHPFQSIVNPNTDLSELNCSTIKHSKWINSLKK